MARVAVVETEGVSGYPPGHGNFIAANRGTVRPRFVQWNELQRPRGLDGDKINGENSGEIVARIW